MLRTGGIIITGLIVIILGLAIIATNDGEKTAFLDEELVETTAVLPENEGKLVIVSGTPRLADDGLIVDGETNLRVENALYYERVPLQKVYKEETREIVVDKGEDKVSEDDDKKKTEHHIVTDWIAADIQRDAVVTNDFESYENPPAINLGRYSESNALTLGDFIIDSTDVFDYVQTANNYFTEEELRESCGDYIIKSELDLNPVTDENGHGLLSSGDEIGDVHVIFSYKTLEKAEPVTMIGRQTGNQLVVEHGKLLSNKELVRAGLVSKEDFLASTRAKNASSRKAGIVLMVIGAIIFLFSFNWKKTRKVR